MQTFNGQGRNTVTWTKLSSGKISGTITDRGKRSEGTGMQPIATGSARLDSLPRPAHPYCQGDPTAELPASIRPIASASTALLVSWMRFGETELDASLAGEAIECIARMEGDLVLLSRSSDPGDVIDMLQMIAATVQVDVPIEMGIKAYIALLQHLPCHVLELAALEILRTHSVRVLPLPGEILNTHAVQEWIVVSREWPKLCGQWKRRLTRLLD